MNFYNEIEQVAKDKLVCTCGNSDWRNFLFISGGDEGYRAGCKQCATVYIYRDESWHKEIKP